MTVSPDMLKPGDVIHHKGEVAEVLSVRSWTDVLYGKVYGVDILVRGKRARASFAKGTEVELWKGEAA